MLFTSDKVLQVSEITEWIKGSLERDFSDITVEGEISNFRPASSGHCYFSLKDSGALLSAVLFRSSYSRLNFKPTDGMKVTARGRISVYNQRGSYQLICQSLKQKGKGDLLQIIEERKQKLSAEGLFDSQLKKEIPSFPNKIAVVTSPTGAAIRDILQVLHRRNPKISIVLLPAAVQGEDAARQISNQIFKANKFKLGDVLIIGRGGGSLEDLMAFNEESVVRAVYESEIPVISAVGHEIDLSLSDLASDLRAPTPSAAAELAAPDLEGLLLHLVEMKKNLPHGLQNILQSYRNRLNICCERELKDNLTNKLQPLMQRLDDLKENQKSNIKELIYRKGQELLMKQKVLGERNPLTPLERGFARITRLNGENILDSKKLNAGDNVLIKFRDGQSRALIEENEK